MVMIHRINIHSNMFQDHYLSILPNTLYQNFLCTHAFTTALLINFFTIKHCRCWEFGLMTLFTLLAMENIKWGQNFQLGDLTNAAEVIELCLAQAICLRRTKSSSVLYNALLVNVNIHIFYQHDYFILSCDINSIFLGVLNAKWSIYLDVIIIWTYSDMPSSH